MGTRAAYYSPRNRAGKRKLTQTIKGSKDRDCAQSVGAHVRPSRLKSTQAFRDVAQRDLQFLTIVCTWTMRQLTQADLLAIFWIKITSKELMLRLNPQI
jgi:hypothetical protein